jgi:hypothetical protein
VDGVEAFAFEHSMVAVVHVIQRCERIETQLFELLVSFSVIAPLTTSDEIQVLSTGKSLIHARMKGNVDGSALSRAGDAVIRGP